MDSDESYPCGWAPKGQRCEAQKPGNRTTRERVNLVAGLKNGSLIAPVIFNILVFHLLMNLSGIVPGAIATICWFLVFSSVRPAFDGILRDQPQRA